MTGAAAEQSALDYLAQQHLRLVMRNFRCKGGEIDLVMQDGEVLVFVEVRWRASAQFGGAAASVTRSKQNRLIIAAHTFLARYRAPPPCRFDVVAFESGRMVWLKNAIEAG